MPKKLKTKHEVYLSAQQICTEINQQIPLASNRYYYQSGDEQQFIEELEYAEIEYYINRHITELFRIYTHQNALTGKALSSSEKRNFSAMAINSVSDVYEESKWVRALLQKPLRVTLDALRDNLIKNIDEKLNALQNNEGLKIRNARFEALYQFSMRMALDNELIKRRILCDKQGAVAEDAHYGQRPNHVSAHDNLYSHLIKMNAFVIGHHWDETRSSAGYCGEHSSLALYKIFKSRFIFDIHRVEIITIDNLHGKGVIEDHAFLVINRDTNGHLNNPATWGDDAIILDPWNQLVCYAAEFRSIPDDYQCYPASGNWKSVSYTAKDIGLFYDLEKHNKDYAMTETSDIDIRSAIIMDEYQLSALDNEHYQNTYHFLIDLVKVIQSGTFKTPVDLYITTCSNKLITPVSGLKKIAIAIHKDFFKLIEEGKASISDLQIGIASAHYEIIHHGLIGRRCKLELDIFLKCDSELISNCKNGDGLIRYLRLYHQFLKSHQHQDHQWENNLLDYVDTNVQQSIIEQRIKAIQSLLASQEHRSIQIRETKLPISVTAELAPLQFKTYYTEPFNTKKSVVEQLNYLASRLHDLNAELLPYELHQDSLSRRLREYCFLLESITIDFSNADHLFAANELIQKSYDARVPGFDKIYSSITKPQRNKYGEIEELPALGPFLKLSQLMTSITRNMLYIKASSLAEEIVALWDNKLVCHFVKNTINTASKYTLEFYSANQRYPGGTSRFFGSDIGTYITFDNAVKNSSMLLYSMREYSDKGIAKLLFILGNHSSDVLNIFQTEDLFTLIHRYHDCKVNGFTFGATERLNVFVHIMNRVSLNTSMFETEISFREKVELFITQNANLLTTPEVCLHEDQTPNFNGVATRYLLDKFAGIIQSGTEEEKRVVKEFFLSRNVPNSLYYIQSRYESRLHTLEYDSLFVKFIVKGRYNNTDIDLFTLDEKISFCLYSQIFIGNYKLLGKHYLQLFNSKNEQLTLNLLEEKYSQLVKHDLVSCDSVSRLLKEHLKQVTPYQLLSSNTQKIIELLEKTCGSLQFRASIYSILFKKIEWNLPDTGSQLSFRTLKKLAFLYPALNEFSNFPSLTHRIHFQQLLVDGIKQSGRSQQFELLKIILFNAQFTGFIYDYQFSKTLIDLFIENAATLYDIDDSSAAYFDNIKPLVELIGKYASARDKEVIFARLLDRIQAQQVLCQFVSSYFHKVKVKNYKGHEFFDDVDNNKISGISALSLYFGQEENDQQALISFFSHPLSESSIHQFSDFIANHKHCNTFITQMGMLERQGVVYEEIRYQSINLYQQFWDASIQERALIFEHLLIPAQHTSSDDKERDAYFNAFHFVGKRLFPDADIEDADDHFAMALLHSYLETSNKYQRSILLAGILVASNNPDNSNLQTTGRKLALLCEYMGPAYVKLAQAIHSHPGTPASIRNDLAHVKGHANPPKRWDIWRLIELHLIQSDKNKLKHVGRLLGSGSYNIALDVALHDDSQAVLILLRDNAAFEANRGFCHLGKTIGHCWHRRMNSIREPLLSILSEAEKQAIVEMDPVASQKQFSLAQGIYTNQRVKLSSKHFIFTINPAQFICGGDGYRIITKLDGIEFNELPSELYADSLLKKEVAQAVMTIELTNIFSGLAFDSDRHGNQIRVSLNGQYVQLGLYDFGEMALENPSAAEIELLCHVLDDLPAALLASRSFETAFESILNKYINSDTNDGSKNYLMRIRKAILALHDFKIEFSNDELISIIKNVAESHTINESVRKSLNNALQTVSRYQFANNIANFFTGIRKNLGHTFWGYFATRNADEQNSNTVRPKFGPPE